MFIYLSIYLFPFSFFQKIIKQNKKTKKGRVDPGPPLARRIGFVSIPLACLVIRVGIQTWRMLDLELEVYSISWMMYLLMMILIWIGTIFLKIFIGTQLVMYSRRQTEHCNHTDGIHARNEENNNQETSQKGLNEKKNNDDDEGENNSSNGKNTSEKNHMKKGNGNKVILDHVDRFMMVKSRVP